MFILSKRDSEKLDWWLSVHDMKCPFARKPSPMITGRLTYCFTPTVNGEKVVIKCVCGIEIELTNGD